ncbi:MULTISPECIES: hypothetical protein [unclassified Flavobacterium]|uniref:hypothetical protein n=1 Tax=unclassified Flavobacterium TaxID=196869 RepID=UPI001F13AA71|nr:MULTISPECIES: hypothetical protein [unclassified Flavobacterium]UMY64792.1 hypothetical protein MKO97_09730 [Flavobacterium sp. HJ-32-4]
MKTLVSVALFFFVAFLATPTLVSLIERSSDTSAFFTMNEEEQSPSVESTLITDVWTPDELPPVVVMPRLKTTIHAELRLKHDNVTPSIFVPPPNA